MIVFDSLFAQPSSSVTVKVYDAVETGETVTLAVVALVDHKYVAVPPAGLIVMLGVRVTGVPEETVFAPVSYTHLRAHET